MEKLTLGTFLRMHRRKAGLTQEQAAAIAGLNVRTIRAIEGGHIEFPHRNSIEQLSAALALGVHDHDTLLTISGHTLTASEISLISPIRRGVVNDTLEQLTTHNRRHFRQVLNVTKAEVGPDRRLTSVANTSAFVARVQGVRTYAIIIQPSRYVDGDRLTIESPGRTVVPLPSDSARGLKAFWLDLGAPMDVGASRVVHYSINYRSAWRDNVAAMPRSEVIGHGYLADPPPFVIELSFDRFAIPREIFHEQQRSPFSVPERVGALAPDSSGRVAIAVTGGPAGGHSIAWHW